MVCIAAFIILALIGIFVAVISIFKPKVGKSYLKMLSKSWECLWKKVRLQKCETGFKEDVKNTLLSKVIVKHPTWVKPLSVIIEIISVIIVIVAIWALLTAIKSLLALWVFGSCNVTKPSACSMGSEVCSIDESDPDNPIEGIGRWFSEWGEIFEAIPEKFQTYDPNGYDFSFIPVNPAVLTIIDSGNVKVSELAPEPNDGPELPTAVDIFDPGCSVCMHSYRNQKEDGFFTKYNTHLVPFPIQDADGNYKFKNSELITRYLFASEQYQPGLGLVLIDKLFTENGDNDISYQNLFNDFYDAKEAADTLDKWLSDTGVDEAGISRIHELKDSHEITDQLDKNRNIITGELKIKSIPTMLYDGAKHIGLYKSN